MMAFRTVLNCFSSDGCYFLVDLHNLLETNKLVKNLGIEKTETMEEERSTEQLQMRILCYWLHMIPSNLKTSIACLIKGQSHLGAGCKERDWAAPQTY